MNYRILDNDTITIGGAVLKRIVCVTSLFASGQSISVGTLGGYVQSENNLAQTGTCWIGAQAKVYGKARISENAVVIGDSEVSGRAKIDGDAFIDGRSLINGCAHIYGTAEISDSKITGISSIGAGRHESVVFSNVQIGLPKKVSNG